MPVDTAGSTDGQCMPVDAIESTDCRCMPIDATQGDKNFTLLIRRKRMSLRGEPRLCILQTADRRYTSVQVSIQNAAHSGGETADKTQDGSLLNLLSMDTETCHHAGHSAKVFGYICASVQM